MNEFPLDLIENQNDQLLETTKSLNSIPSLIKIVVSNSTEKDKFTIKTYINGQLTYTVERDKGAF